MAIRRGRERAHSLDREIDELIRMRAQGLITDDEYIRQKKLITEQRATMRNKRSRIVNAGQIRKHLAEITEPLVKLRATWELLQPSFRVRFNRLLLPAGFANGNIRTAQLGLLFSTTVAFGTRNSIEVPSASLPLNHFDEEIQAFWDVLNGVEAPEPVPKRRFENSHRNRLRWRRLNQEAL